MGINGVGVLFLAFGMGVCFFWLSQGFVDIESCVFALHASLSRQSGQIIIKSSKLIQLWMF